MSAARATAPPVPDEVGWHDAECAAYEADLPLWRRLAAERGDPVLDLGCGTGRVAIDLARRGHRVIAADRDPALVAALGERAEGLPVRALVADARQLSLPEPVPLALCAMQLVQLLDGPVERARLLATARVLLVPGGLLAAAIVEPKDAGLARPGPGGPVPGRPGPEPDTAVLSGRRYESAVTGVCLKDGWLSVERHRSTGGAGGAPRTERHIVRLRVLEAAELEAEARTVGLAPAGRRHVPPTRSHVGSTVCLLEAPSR